MKTLKCTPSCSRFRGARLMPVAALALAGSLSHLQPALAASDPPGGGPPPVAQTALRRTDRLFFIENKGQWHEDVLYLARLGGLDAWITRYGVNYTFYKVERKETERSGRRPRGKFDLEVMENSTLLGHRVLFELQGHNPNPAREGLQKQEGYYNYLIGNDPSKHATHVGLYKEALVKDVYPGIDLRYYFDRGFLRYDFVVHPGADPAQIRFNLKGQDADEIKANKLVYTTRFGEVQMAELRSYQSRGAVQSRLVKQGDGYGIALGRYDNSQTLIIDPLVYSTYIGGSSNEDGYGIAVDGSGNAYVTGSTGSFDYDVTAGAFQTSLAGIFDVFVTKLNASGTGLMYSTYIGGSLEDIGSGIAVDGSGQAYVTGWTESTDYPVTPGAFQTSHGGGLYDVFVTKLNASGTNLMYSTYVGGGSWDVGSGIAVDGSGQAYVTGMTASSSYDVTPGAFQTSLAGSADVFVTKLNASGTGLIYSTYIGGSEDDWGYGIAVDGSWQAYVTGWTGSTDYPVTPGAFQTTYGGDFSDVFVTKLHATGSSLAYSTYLGGSSSDLGSGIAVDGSGQAYVTGPTESTDYPVTPGAFQTSLEGSADVFVTKLNATGTALMYSTYIGGSASEGGGGIAIDGSGQAYVTGDTWSTDYDVTPGAFQTSFGGGLDDVFVTKLNTSGTGLIYSTYIGGSNDDVGSGIAIDGSGAVYVTGYTYSTDYDVTAGAFQTTHGGVIDVFVTKLNPCAVSTFYQDADGDGYGNPLVSILACSPPPGYVADNTDCDDSDPNNYPGNTEIWDCQDNDCDGLVDEGTGALPLTQLNAVSCGVTVPNYVHVLRANAMAGAIQYEFEFKDGTNTYYELRPNRGFYFSLFTWPTYSTTYQVRVRWFDGSNWSCWGPMCTVTTPPPPTTWLDAASCGATATSPAHVFRAISMPGATQYEFEFDDGVNTYYELRPNRGFYFSLFTWDQFSTTYTVKVRWHNGTMWSPWGPPCNVTTSSMPTTQLQPGDCGATVTSTAQVLRANAMAGADQYEFKLSDGSNTWYLLRPNRGTYLLLFGAGPWPAGSYTMEVRWRDAGTMTWSAWGPPCGLTLPMALDAEAEGVTEGWFDVKAFPVPFGDVVNVTVETFSTEPVHVTVTDVNGRVVEDRRVQMEHNGLLTMGANWANGVYMLRVQQGAEVRTLRVVKARQ